VVGSLKLFVPTLAPQVHFKFHRGRSSLVLHRPHARLQHMHSPSDPSVLVIDPLVSTPAASLVYTKEWDPMIGEAYTHSQDRADRPGQVAQPLATPRPQTHVPASPGLTLPVLEPIFFKNGPEMPPLSPARPSPTQQSRPSTPFVTTMRGEPPTSSEEVLHPVDVASFTELISPPLEAPALRSPPRRCRTKPPPASAPRHSSRLAKKAISWTPAVAAAQNVLIQKLGLGTGPQVDSAVFEKYLNLFQEGLTKEQAKLIGDLFTAQLPASKDHGWKRWRSARRP
jgi:hypothetical protein